MNIPIYQINFKRNHRDMRFFSGTASWSQKNINNDYVFLYVVSFLIISILLMNMRIFHNYDFLFTRPQTIGTWNYTNTDEWITLQFVILKDSYQSAF